jgi:hypothetical protein
VIAPYTDPLKASRFPHRPSTGQLELWDTSTPWNEVELDTLLVTKEGLHSPLLSYRFQQQRNQASSLRPALQTTQIPSTSSVVIRRPEWEALQYFERIFTTIYSPKPFTWSICAIMGQYGKKHGAIQHLIIAVCLGQLKQTSEDGTLWDLGKSHYQVGAQLIMQEMQQEQRDHCKVFVAFWLMQVTYNIYWSDKAATSLEKLSQAMAQYTRKNQLLKLFTKRSTASQSQGLGTMTEKERSFLSRLLIFTLYEDIDASFCHVGGSFAAEVCANNAIKNVYVAGKFFLSQYFEEDYPQDELVDDIQRANLLDLHFEANLALHMINQASKDNPSRQSFEMIANHLEDLKSVRTEGRV